MSWSQTRLRILIFFFDIRIRFITAHLPHTGFGDDDFKCGLLQLEPIIEGARRERFAVVLGIDANAVLGKRWDTDSDSVMGDYGMQERNVRGKICCPWLRGMRLANVASKFDRNWEDVWTHKSWSTGRLRQIDCVFVDSWRTYLVSKCGVRLSLEGKSDHRAPFVDLLWSSRAMPSGQVCFT